MSSGRLAFATRRVDIMIMAASVRAPLALCGWLTILPPYNTWEKNDQMVVRVQGAPDKVDSDSKAVVFLDRCTY